MLLGVIVAACSSPTDATIGADPAAPWKVDNVATANPFRAGRTLVIPHAGGDGMYPENTMFAYEQSQAMGGDVIDIDVRIAADGVLVAFHDSTLDRTTEATGPLAAMTSAELAELDAGFDFERDGTFPYRGAGLGVPTVEEILRAFPDTLTTLDLKIAGADRLRVGAELAVDVYVGTDSNDQPGLFRVACPEVHTSGTREERQIRRAAQEAGESSSPIPQMVSQPPFIGGDDERHITEEYLAFAHASDTAVLTWVIDDAETLRHLIEIGVDGVYTRRPDIMLEVLDDLGLRTVALTTSE